jgi:hypothetical protein
VVAEGWILAVSRIDTRKRIKKITKVVIKRGNN